MKSSIRILAFACLAAALGSSAVAGPRSDNWGVAQAHAAPPPGQANTTFDIVVNKFGRRIRGSEGTSAFQGGPGTYIAKFPVDVTSCIYVATLGRATTNGGTDEGAGFITVVRSSGFSNGVFVQTFGMHNRLRNRPFHLLVAC
jgi:hypothetical protein